MKGFKIVLDCNFFMSFLEKFFKRYDYVFGCVFGKYIILCYKVRVFEFKVFIIDLGVLFKINDLSFLCFDCFIYKVELIVIFIM